MLKRFSKLLLLLLVCSSFTGHKFYVSHYRIDYKDKALQVTVKIFTDDLEKAISTGGKTYRVTNTVPPLEEAGGGNQLPDLNRVLFNYLNAHLKIKANGAGKTLEWVGFENEADVTWLYMEIPLNSPPTSLGIFCNGLVEIYADQVNLFNVSVKGEKKTFFLNENAQEMQLSFN